MQKHDYTYHVDDLPQNVNLVGDLAIDTEAMGLNLHRDRLCVIQICDENGNIHLVHFKSRNYEAPNLLKLLRDKERKKIFHYARFDVGSIYQYLGVEVENIFCTKIASKLCRTYSNYHGLSDLCSNLLGVKISKQQQTSDWGSEELTDEQLQYAAQDVEHLHKLRDKCLALLKREGKLEIAQSCFDFVATKSKLDLLGWTSTDIFAHQ
jgi:ribonuclease D